MSASRILLNFINLVFALIEGVIALRIILRFLNANPSTPFVRWVNDASSSLIYPFQNIFPSPVLTGGFVLEMSAVIALVVYAIIAYIISGLISFVSYKTVYYTRDGRKKVVEEE